MIQFMWEVASAAVGPDCMWRGIRCDFPTIEFVQVVADPNPFPRMRLFRWLPA